MLPVQHEQLLLIEPDDCRAKELSALLAECGWWVARVPTFSAANVWLERGNFRAIVLNRRLSDGDGLHILSTICRRWPSVSVIVTASNPCTDDHIDFLEAGADEYIAMPCDRRELRARFNTLLRRVSHRPNSISVKDLQLWKDTRIALYSGRSIQLSRTEFDLLLCLAASHPEPVNRSTLLKKVFNLNIEPGTNVLEVHIHRLRKKLSDIRTDPQLQTIRGKGYALC